MARARREAQTFDIALPHPEQMPYLGEVVPYSTTRHEIYRVSGVAPRFVDFDPERLPSWVTDQSLLTQVRSPDYANLPAVASRTSAATSSGSRDLQPILRQLTQLGAGVSRVSHHTRALSLPISNLNHQLGALLETMLRLEEHLSPAMCASEAMEMEDFGEVEIVE